LSLYQLRWLSKLLHWYKVHLEGSSKTSLAVMLGLDDEQSAGREAQDEAPVFDPGAPQTQRRLAGMD
jgi:hypothetical protein